MNLPALSAGYYVSPAGQTVRIVRVASVYGKLYSVTIEGSDGLEMDVLPNYFDGWMRLDADANDPYAVERAAARRGGWVFRESFDAPATERSTGR